MWVETIKGKTSTMPDIVHFIQTFGLGGLGWGINLFTIYLILTGKLYTPNSIANLRADNAAMKETIKNLLQTQAIQAQNMQTVTHEVGASVTHALTAITSLPLPPDGTPVGEV